MSVNYVLGKSITTKSVPPSINNPVTPAAQTYTRPADWLALPSISTSDEKFAGLFAVKESGPNFVALVAQGNYTVDWGDGSPTENITSGTQANHNFDWASVSSGTVTSKGFRQVIITVVPQAGAHLTNIDLSVKYNLTSPEGGTINAYGVGWLDIKVGSPYFANGQFGNNTSNITYGLLEQIQIVKASNTSGLTLFNGCRGITSLRNFIFPASAGYVASCPFAFFGCVSLINAPDMDLSQVGSTSNMFGNCYSLVSVPAYDLHLCSDFSSMFSGCQSLEKVPKFVTTAISGSTVSAMFLNCYSLVEVPDYFMVSINYVNMFSGCRSLRRAPLLDLNSATSLQTMFTGCSGLVSVPSYATTATNLLGMFQNCTSLAYVPKMDFSFATVMDSMFSGCYALQEVEGITTGSGLYSVGNMFQNCRSLKTAPYISNLSGVNFFGSMFAECSSLSSLNNFEYSYTQTANTNANMTTMFSNCMSLTSTANISYTKATNTALMYFTCPGITTVDGINLVSATSTANMFDSCRGLISFANVNLTNSANTSGMFTNCTKLSSVNFTSYTGAGTLVMAGMFNGCVSLSTAPTIDTSKAISFGTTFNSCQNLVSIPAYDLGNLTVAPTTWLSGSNSVSSIQVVNTKLAVNYGSLNLSRTTLYQVMDNLGSPATTQTLTITSNPGADTAVTSNLTAGQAAGSTTLTVASSASFTVGMWVTNSVCFSTIACTFQDAGDTVTKTAHGLANGTRISFATIVTTTGISINTIYYVINATTDTFQVATTAGGSALPLTNNGTGTMKYEVYVTGKPSGTQVTVSAPTTAITTATALSGRNLNTYRATLKNWTVTG